MSIVLKIAFRNLMQHRTKTLIIGLLIAIGITVLVVGNSLMDTAARGIRQTYIESYTGHIVITGEHRGNLSIVGMQGPESLDAVIPTVPEYDAVLEYVTAHPDVLAVNPQATAMAMVDFGEQRAFSQLFGIDPASYTAMFPKNIEILKGSMLAPGEEGILLSQEIASQLRRDDGQEVSPGDELLFTSMTQSSGIKVREIPVRGIFRFRHSNPQLDFVSLMDITNVRALAGMNLSYVAEAELTPEEKALLSEVDEDPLFGGGDEALFLGDMIEEVEIGSDAQGGLFEAFGDAPEAGAESNSQSESKPGAESSDRVVGEDSRAWHFLLVKLRDGADPRTVIGEFRRHFQERGIPVRVSDWLSGAGAVAMLAYGTKNVFNVVVLVIAVVAVIIIMNTLVISVTERTTEIGTMRALGAQKAFVRRMIAWETVITAGLFGLLGIVLGCVVLLILNITGIEAPNVFFEVLFGGKVLHPAPSLGSIILSLVVVVAVGLVSSLYPVSIALKTKPIKAMQGS